jgi:hypothetical protein
MPKEPSLAELKEERRHVLRIALSGSCGDAWPRVRQHLIDSPSIFTDRHVHTIWEGPGRGWLLPLPFEVLRDFVQRFGNDATKELAAALRDTEPNVVGYALHALSQIDSEHFQEYAPLVSDRTEPIHSIFGSFGWEGSLAEYALHLRDNR